MILDAATTWAMRAALLALPLVFTEESPAQEHLSLEVRVVGINGAPVDKSSIALWRLTSEAHRIANDNSKRARLFWVEAATGKVWEPLGGVSTGDRWQRSDLALGTYRATAHLGHEQATPVGVSDDVTLDGRHENTVVTIRLRAGSTITIDLFDLASHRPLPGVKADLTRENSDTTMPPHWTWTSRGSGENGRITIEHLPPGTYRLNAGRPAMTPEDLSYSAAEKGRKLIVTPQRDQVVPVAMVGRPLDAAEIENRWGWVATGTVVDEAGRPIAGADVRVATGWGSLFGGGSTKTDAAGCFTVRFAEGWQSPDPANAQAVLFNVTKNGYVEKSRSRPGRHLMARRMPAASARFDVEPTKIILRGTPYRIDFRLARPASIEVDLRGPADATLAVIGRDDSNDGTFSSHDGPNRWDLAPGQPWRFALPHRHKPFSVTSFPITFPNAGRYLVTLSYQPDRDRGVDVLGFVSVTGPDGRDIRDQVVGDDPLARPAVPEALQQRGRDLLTKMAETNRIWLGAGSREAKTYEYRFHVTGQEPQTFKVGGHPSSGDVRRGISYFSSLHHLASNPAVVTFRQVDIGKDRVTLAYTLKEPIKVWAGNGVARRWQGYFSMPWRDGVLVLDSRRLTPLEHRSPALTETFSQYIEVGKGLFVPLAIRLDQRGMRFEWTFQLVEPALWLFGSSDYGGEVVARVDQIKVDGVAAKVIARGKHEVSKPQ